MYTDIAAISPSTGAKTAPLDLSTLLKLVAEHVGSHPMGNLGGIDLIEHRPLHEVDKLDVGKETVFSVMADQLEMLGVATDRTVGGVMEKLGFPRSSFEAREAAHEIGCTCHGPYISPHIASQRILNLIQQPA